jgi:hypothetical protein
MMVILITGINTTKAQANNVDDVSQLITKITELMDKYYVSIEDAGKINTLLKKNLASGVYSSIVDPNKLASKITGDVRSINGDMHLNISYVPPIKENQDSVKSHTETVNKSGIWSNYGIQEIKIMTGNIGYIKFNHFGQWKFHKEHRKAITAAISFLQHTDLLIMDVQDNQGGYEDIVAFLISYFFSGKPIHLSDYYIRYNNETKSLWTKTDIPGPRLPDIPLYILINGNTTSAGESLAYMLKHLKRATLIGKSTVGAGNGAITHNLDERFKISISSAKTINAVTKKSLEGIGVIPHIESNENDLISQAYTMALDHLKTNNTRSISPDNYEKIKLMMPPKEVKGHLKMNEYAGIYENNGIKIEIKGSDSYLDAQIEGKGSAKFIPAGNHVFIVEMVNERIEFILNDNGKVIRLIGLDSPLDLPKIQ